MATLDILVVGDKGHSRAKCVDWMEPFPNIEEFDLVIITLNTLTQEIFDRIPDKTRNMKPEIATLIRTGRSVWCILEKMLIPSPPKTGFKGFVEQPATNWDWCIAWPIVKEVKEGYTVEIKDEEFRPYLSKVKKWNLEIESIYQIGGGPGGLTAVEAKGLTLEPIALNKSEKYLGATIGPVDLETYGDGSICLLPKPTECDTSEAVDILIDIATGEDKVEPDWMKNIEIPGIQSLQTEIQERKSRMTDLDKEIAGLVAQSSELEKYRDVFSIHEEPQVQAVKRILKDLDIDSDRTDPGFPVDLRGNDVAVEVTSVAGKIDASSEVMFQLTRFIDKQRKNEKVILVANTYKRENPDIRRGKENFTQPVLDFLKASGVCAMTSTTLLALWKFAKKDRQKAKVLLLSTVGELKL